MAWTDADLETLETAIASGTLRVRYEGPPAREITYQNLTEMLKLRGLMRTELGLDAGTRQKFRFAKTKKGFE